MFMFMFCLYFSFSPVKSDNEAHSVNFVLRGNCVDLQSSFFRLLQL